MSPRRTLLAGLLVGGLLRALVLPLPGTGDVTVWKVWSFAGAHDLTAMYGIGGQPPERRVLHWQGIEMTVDYPPIALAELALAGRLYRAWDPTFRDGPTLNAAMKLPALVAELAFIAWLWWGARRYLGEAAATWAILAFWLNPGVWIDGAALGYLDMQMAVPAALALVAAWRRKPALASVLLVLAVLTKAQALFVAPVIGVVILRHSAHRWMAVIHAVLAGTATATVVLVPFALRGAWSNLTQALSRLATHDMLSAQAANIWWIVTWLLRVIDVGPEWGWWPAWTQDVRILAISRAVALGYPNARTVGTVLVLVALAWACWQAWRRESFGETVALGAWSMYAYALFAAQVHENHLAPAIVLLVPAAAVLPRLRPVLWLLSFVVATNLYLFYGLGEGWPPSIPRSFTGIDATVLLAFVNLGGFGLFTARLARASR